MSLARAGVAVLLALSACRAAPLPVSAGVDRRIAVERPEALFRQMPAEIDVAARFLADYDEPIPPRIVAVMRRAAGIGFAPARVATVWTTASAPRFVAPPPRTLAAIGRLLAAQERKPRPATGAAVDPQTAALAASLPNVGLRAEQGLTALRMWVVLGTVAHKLPKELVARLYATPAIVARGMPDIMAWTRSMGEAGGGFPAMAKARDAAVADNLAALRTLSADDVRALTDFYLSPAGRAQTAALTKAFAAANDAAASATFIAFYPEAVRYVPQY